MCSLWNTGGHDVVLKAECPRCAGALRRAIGRRPTSSQTAAKLLVTSMHESKPKPISATLPAITPAATAIIASAEFHAIVRY
jgi:hypothetical protein